MSDSDRDLFDGWRSGDKQAGAALFERHRRAIEGFFARRAGEAARDLVQETWLQCLKSHDGYRGAASFRTFLFAVAHNVLRHHLRRRNRPEPDLGIADIAMSQPSPISLLQRRREFALLGAALSALDAEHRMLLEMSYEAQLDSGQIAELLQIPSATVRTRIRRARELLRERVEALARDAGLLASTLEVFDIWAKSQPPEPSE